jgi:DNA helicase-2/ATP-dependent DNA helicase PcrA
MCAVVGDDAQSIYSFAEPPFRTFLQFQKDYDDVKVIKLEQNYRSTQTILNIANEVIKNNKGQIPKTLFTENVAGEKIKLVRTMTDNDEGNFVADQIQENRLRNHYRNKEFADSVSHQCAKPLLRRKPAPGQHSLTPSMAAFHSIKRKEVKDYIAYLRIIVNPKDEEALKRIINYPYSGHW